MAIHALRPESMFDGPSTCSMDIEHVLWPQNVCYHHGTCSMAREYVSGWSRCKAGIPQKTREGCENVRIQGKESDHPRMVGQNMRYWASCSLVLDLHVPSPCRQWTTRQRSGGPGGLALQARGSEALRLLRKEVLRRPSPLMISANRRTASSLPTVNK